MRADLYQQMLHEISEQVQLADELGYDSVSFTEHHFHIEGFEVSNNPVLLDLYSAMQTSGSGSASSVSCCRAANPIRVAEDNRHAPPDHRRRRASTTGAAQPCMRRAPDSPCALREQPLTC
jgi:luciferase-like monooxygenase